MHEAGIAVAVAAEIRDRGLDPSRVRLLVSGGHGDAHSFDAALRAHLDAAAPSLGLGAVRIVHAPVPRLCANCASQFRAASAEEPCPTCGGPSIILAESESIELEWDEPDHSVRGLDSPSQRDSRPSMPAAPERDAVVMRRPVGSGRT